MTIYVLEADSVAFALSRVEQLADPPQGVRVVHSSKLYRACLECLYDGLDGRETVSEDGEFVVHGADPKYVLDGF